MEILILGFVRKQVILKGFSVKIIIEPERKTPVVE